MLWSIQNTVEEIRFHSINKTLCIFKIRPTCQEAIVMGFVDDRFNAILFGNAKESLPRRDSA